MKISDLKIAATSNTPEYFLSSQGIIRIKGRGFTETKSEIYNQIMRWIDEYLNDPAEFTYLIISFEYLNSASASILVSMIREITKVVGRKKKYVIRWYYEEDDDDIHERGEYIASALNIPIEFIAVNDIAFIPGNSFSEGDKS